MNKSPDRLDRMNQRLGGREYTRVVPENIPITNVVKNSMPDSVLSCGCSHRHAWSIMNSEYALILEDDATFKDGFFEIVDNLVIPDDADIFLLGYNGQDGGLLYKIFEGMTKRQYVDHGEYFEPAGFGGLHCYIITRKGAQKLKDITIDYHVDVKLNMMENVKIYAHKDCLSVQEMLNDSSISVSKYNLLDVPFSFKDNSNIPFNYYLNAPIKKVGNAIVTVWFIFFVLCGYLGIFPLIPLIITNDTNLLYGFLIGLSLKSLITLVK